jgi:hypothetical protein
MVSNRPGGVSLVNGHHDTLDFFLTRRIANVNIDKGLPNRLDDMSETRLEFLFALNSSKTLGTQKRLIDHMNDRPFIIEPFMF